MLPTINLPLTDATALSGEMGESLSPAGGATSPEGSFAELLRAPVMVTSSLVDGDALPAGGNELPAGGAAEAGEPGPLHALLRKQSDAPFADLQAARSAIALEEARPLAEEQALQLAEDQALPLVSPLPAVAQDASARPTAITLANGQQSREGLQPIVTDTARTGSDGDSAGQGRRGATEPLPSLLSTGQGDAAAARTPGIGPLPGADSGSGLPGNSAGQQLSAPALATAAPLAAQPAFAPSATATTTAAAPLIDSIAVPVQNTAWGDALNERLVFMSGQKIQNAEIRLTPAELGPIRVSVAVEDGATHITFNAQHATTREAIESALPRLREMLAEQGLSLGNASVNDQQGGDPRQQDGSGESASGVAATDHGQPGADLPKDADARGVRVTRGLVDTFA